MLQIQINVYDSAANANAWAEAFILTGSEGSTADRTWKLKSTMFWAKEPGKLRNIWRKR